MNTSPEVQTGVMGNASQDVFTPSKSNSIFGGNSAPTILSGLADNPAVEEGDKETLKAISSLAPKTPTVSSLLSELNTEQNETEEDKTSQVSDTEASAEGDGTADAGIRASKAKDTMVQYLKEQIEAGEFETFDDYKEGQNLDEYLSGLTEKDRKSLLTSNLAERENKKKQDIRKEVLSSLPGSLQYAARMVENGASEQELQALYADLIQVESNRSLDINNETDQEIIAYSYLQATNFGNQQQIQEQVEEWKNDGKLEAKAKQFKPGLDQMDQQRLQAHIQQQEEYNRQQQEIQKYYNQNVYEALKKGEISGIKLSKKQQNEFFNGLTNVYQAPVSGNPVNSLHAKLEEIQFSDNPNYELLVKVNWLLNDEKGFEEALMQKAKNIAAIETEKKLKSAQFSSPKAGYEEPEQQSLKKRGIAKQRNIFA